MLYFKVLKNQPEEGNDVWAYEKVDESLFTVEGLLRDMRMADGYSEVSEEEYLAEVAEGTESSEEVEVALPEEAVQ